MAAPAAGAGADKASPDDAAVFRIRWSQPDGLRACTRMALPSSIGTLAKAIEFVAANPEVVPKEAHHVWQWERIHTKSGHAADLIPVDGAGVNDHGDGVKRHLIAFRRIQPLCIIKGLSVSTTPKPLEFLISERKQIARVMSGTHYAHEVSRILSEHHLGELITEFPC
jgi:hypothetical protein